MKIYYLFFLSILIGSQSLNVHAQTYQVYAITSSDKKGLLQRIEEYVQQRLVRKTVFGKDGQLLFTIRQVYNPQGLLEERTQTFHQEYEYDLIRQFTYNDKGQKTGELFGNNRTGKWGSYRFEYNEQEQVHLKNIYQKNGDHTQQQFYEYQYDEQGRVILEKRSTKDIETDEIQLNNIITQQYPQPNKQLMIVKDGENQVVLKEEKIRLPSKRQQIQITQLGDTDQIKEVIMFNSKEQAIQKEEYLNDQWQKTTSYQYDTNGIRTLEKHRFSDGTFGGSKYELSNERNTYNYD